MQTNLMLCDWAEVVQGKLYIQGSGWSRILANQPVQMAIAMMTRVPYDQTNRQHRVDLKLQTEDGQSYPTEAPIAFDFMFELGRPPGMKQGQEQILPFAAKLGGLTFVTGGS